MKSRVLRENPANTVSKVHIPDNVPLYAPGQNSRNEKYIQTSVTGRSLHHLTEFITRRLQEEVDRSGIVCQVLFPMEPKNKASDFVEMCLVIIVSGYGIFDRSRAFVALGRAFNTSTARLLRAIPDSTATPCSVNARGGFRVLPQLDVPKRIFKFLNSSLGS